MNLIRFERSNPWLPPVHRLGSLREEINRLFETSFGEAFNDLGLTDGWTPALDVYEGKDQFTVNLELPGTRKEDIHLTLHEHTLTISGERKSERTEQEGAVSRTERVFGRFQRTITLPKPVDADKVSAQYKDGLLIVTIGKTEESKPRQIEVKVA